MSNTPSIDKTTFLDEEADKSLDSVRDALEREDFELLAEVTSEYIKICKRNSRADAAHDLLYSKYLNLFANGYRRWQISYDYTGIRNYFYAAKWEILRAKPVPILEPALSDLTVMLNAYTRCENSFINDDPSGLEWYAKEAQKAERKGLTFLRHVYPKDNLGKLIKKWLHTYFAKNLRLHTGLEACSKIYAKLLSRESCRETDFEKEIGLAKHAFIKLANVRSNAHSAELASELNAHIRFVEKHYRRTNGPLAESGLSFLRLQEGTVTLCLLAGCDPNVARQIVKNIFVETNSSSKEFKHNIEHNFVSCGLEIRNFRTAPLHDIFQTTFGSYFLQMLTFDLPSITVTVSDAHKGHEKSYHFDVKVKLTSLGSCTVHLTHQVDSAGLTVEEVRTLQSLICPHAGQVKIEIRKDASDWNMLRPIAYRFRERFDFSDLDKLDHLKKGIGQGEPTAEPLHQICQSAIQKAEMLIQELIPGESVKAEAPLEHGCDPEVGQMGLCGDMKKLCELLLSYPDKSQERELRDQFTQLSRVTDFAASILHCIECAFRKWPPPDKTDGGYEHNHRWLISPDTGWYSYVHAGSLQWEDTHGNRLGIVDSFETAKVRDHSDVHGFLIEPREARASFDDWRFMSFRWRDYPNLASIRSHPCDAFFVSQNRAFLFFPDDPKFLADQYEVTVELMMWLGTALKFCEGLSQQLVRDVTECFNFNGSGLDDGNVEKHLDWISALRVQVGVVQALVSKTGISRYADHGELMMRMTENMKFPRIMDLLDKRLAQFDEFYKKGEEDSANRAEHRERLRNLLLAVIGTILGISNIPAIADGYKNHKVLMEWTFGITGIAIISLGIWVLWGIVSKIGVAAEK